MQLNIKNPDVVRSIKRLSELTGLSATQAVKQAVEEAIPRAEHRKSSNPRNLDLDRIDALLKEIWSLPILDHRHPDDILYDEDGMPKSDR